MFQDSFWDTNLFQTIVMIVVGFVAYWIYLCQKRDELEKAAAIVKLEIDNIEEALGRLKLTVVSEDIYKTAPLYQTLEWFNVRSLFIGKLGIEHINAINKFYNMVIVCEDARNRMKEAVHLNRVDKINAVQFHIESILCKIAENNVDKESLENLKKAQSILAKYCDLYNDGMVSPDFIMQSVVEHIERSVNSIFYISNTPAYEKLKEIIKK